MESGFEIGLLIGVFACLAAAIIVLVIFAARKAHSGKTRQKQHAETRTQTQAQTPPDVATRVLPQTGLSSVPPTPDTVVLQRGRKEPAGNTLIVEPVENRDKQFAASVQEVRDLLLHLADLIARTETASGEANEAFHSAKASVHGMQSSSAPEIQEAHRLLVSQIDRVLASNATLHSELARANRDIEERQKQIEELRVQVRIDSLTRIPNRASFDERLSEYSGLLKRSGLPFSLLILDIDHFKNVNDEHGHINGDRILRGIATKLSDSIRDNDFAARYGGEEFAVIFPGTRLREAQPVAERIRSDIERTNFRMDQMTLKITISGGLAECEAGMTPVQIIAAADAALYRSKHAGRNQILSAPPPGA